MGECREMSGQAGGDVADLATLLEYVVEVPGIERIRFTTSHPKEMTPRLIDAFATIPKLASHLHLPVQSGSDRVLAAMKRGYTVLEYKSIVRRVRAARPGISLTSDFIVGFPGESDADFAQTMKLAEDVGFDGAFSFLYSGRPERLPPSCRTQHRSKPSALVSPRCRHCSTRSIARAARPWSARASACWSRVRPPAASANWRRARTTTAS
jgi:tRNA A37 methylthiotransferase MiaB